MKDLRLVNLALIEKWIWMLLIGDPDIWMDICVAKYRGIIISSLRWGRTEGFPSTSSW